jgi:hypothetical protein
MADQPIPRAPSLRRRLPREGSNWRRNSTSDSVSEARNSIRSSTDDLFLPRVAKEDPAEESHWHSAPLGLALLPAIAGVFFQNGSVFVTDVTLLVLAAIFLNWSVRLPWYVPRSLLFTSDPELRNPQGLVSLSPGNPTRGWIRVSP